MNLRSGATAMVDILIVNWNSGDQLASCLRSIEAFGAGLVARVIVVDNGSVDGSADVAAPALPLEIIRTGRNLGFGAACNLGARAGSAPYLLLLNPDAELRDGTLPRAVAHLDAPGHERVGVVGVKLVGEGDVVHRHAARLPDWRSFVGNSVGLFRVAPRWARPIPLEEFDHLSDRSVDHVMGAFYCIRRSLFEGLGGFDEAFFLYMEDLDLSLRVARAGYRIDYLSGVAAFHRQGGTSDQVRARRLANIMESNIVYAWKHFRGPEAAAVTAATLVAEPASRAARAVLNRSPADAGATLAAAWMLYRALPRVWRRARGVRQSG